MSARIGIIKDGELKTVYLNYPLSVTALVALLKDNYTKTGSVEKLFDKGDIHTLKSTIEDTVYFVDKGDPEDAVKPFIEECEDLENVNTDRSPVDYYVIWTNKWNVCEAYTSQWLSAIKFLKK